MIGPPETRRGSRARRAVAALAVLFGVALVLIAVIVAVNTARTARSAVPASTPASVPSHGRSAAPATAQPATSDVALPSSTPVSISIPSIGVSSSLIPLGLNAQGGVQVPPLTAPMQAGWYVHGPTPGQDGPAVILGHIDGYSRQGVFYRLHDLAPGDLVLVARQDGITARFVVTKLTFVPKNAFPTSAVYGNTPDPELRLISCGGAFDRAALSYVDNVVVYARLQM